MTAKFYLKNFAVNLLTRLVPFLKEKIKLMLLCPVGTHLKIIFKELVDSYKGKLNWEKINLFWGDERCVPPGRF